MDKLVEVVKEWTGMNEEELREIRSASDGYSGFTYYKDTCEFYDGNKDLIWEQLSQMADDLGQKPTELVASFGCANSIVDDDTFKNALAWFALETVARYLEDK